MHNHGVTVVGGEGRGGHGPEAGEEAGGCHRPSGGLELPMRVAYVAPAAAGWCFGSGRHGGPPHLRVKVFTLRPARRSPRPIARAGGPWHGGWMLSRQTIVYLASPCSGDVDVARAYALLCVADALGRGDYPVAPTALFVSAFDSFITEDEELQAATMGEVIARCDVFAAYIDMGWTPAMVAERDRALASGMPVEERRVCSSVQA